MLDLIGDETVLEAGCGTGRDTERLLKLLPHGRVIALDGSARMLDLLTRRLAGKLDRIDVIQADLAAPLELPSAVDVVFSVAAFHWVQDHAALFRNLAAVLRRGGRLVADCGGFGNVAQVSAAVEQVTGRPGQEGVWNFARPEETRRILEGSGFSNVKVHLHSEPAQFVEGQDFERYLHSVVLGSHLAHVPATQHAEFVRSVAALLPDLRVDYVRLTIGASR